MDAGGLAMPAEPSNAIVHSFSTAGPFDGSAMDGFHGRRAETAACDELDGETWGMGT